MMGQLDGKVAVITGGSAGIELVVDGGMSQV
jgi:NAD(P)-dependent dehydrogenase (short-subunit alcohol dehydrogenase family)